MLTDQCKDRCFVHIPCWMWCLCSEDDAQLSKQTLTAASLMTSCFRRDGSRVLGQHKLLDCLPNRRRLVVPSLRTHSQSVEWLTVVNIHVYPPYWHRWGRWQLTVSGHGCERRIWGNNEQPPETPHAADFSWRPALRWCIAMHTAHLVFN